MPRDFCKGPRRTYTALIRLLAQNPVIGLGFCCTAPIAAGTLIGLYGDRMRYFFGFTVGVVTVLWVLWLLAIVSVWKIAPNALTISIGLNRAIHHWMAINLFLGVCYGPALMDSIGFTMEIRMAVCCLVFLLHIGVDIQRELRAALYSRLTSDAANQVTATITGQKLTGAPKEAHLPV